MTFMTHEMGDATPMAHWPTPVGSFWQTGPGLIVSMTHEAAEDFASRACQTPLGYWSTWPSYAGRVLDVLEARGQRPKAIAAVLTRGEWVPPDLRAQVRRLLGVPLLDIYSCEELGPVAFECTKVPEHYHVSTSNVIIEILDDEGRPVAPGRSGNVTMTGLNALATPLLRYQPGDVAALTEACPCGHRGQVITRLQGRSRSLLTLPNGRRRNFLLLSANILAAAPQVRESRVLQLDRQRLRLELVADRPLSAAERQALTDLVLARAGSGFAVTVEELPAIDWQGRIKRTTFTNLLV